MQTYAGIDLHSSNCYLAVIDEQQRRLYSKRLPNSLDHILTALQPFKEGLSRGGRVHLQLVLAGRRIAGARLSDAFGQSVRHSAIRGAQAYRR